MSAAARVRREPAGCAACGERIGRRAALADLEPQPALCARLAAYVELLQRWNARLNLTALDASDHGLDRLVIEPLAAARHAARGGLRIIDIGSGGGSPAIPLHMSLGAARLVMVEARQRKAAFLREAIRRLDLADCTVENGRFETLAARPDWQRACDLLTVRGVRIGAAELQRLERFVAPGGQLFLFRSATADALPAEAPPPLERRAELPLVESLGSRLLIYTSMPSAASICGKSSRA